MVVEVSDDHDGGDAHSGSNIVSCAMSGCLMCDV